jgi:hypothetical protein
VEILDGAGGVVEDVALCRRAIYVPYLSVEVRSGRAVLIQGPAALEDFPNLQSNLRTGTTRNGGITSCLLVIVCVNWPRTVEVPSKVEFLIGLRCGLVQ